MTECKIARNLELAKKDVIRIIMFSFCPLPETLEEMDGIKLAVPFSNGRRIIMSFSDEGNDFKVTLELEMQSGNINRFMGKIIRLYDKNDSTDKSVEECLDLIIDKIYSF